MPSVRRSARSGVTLVELLVVMLIIGLTTGVAGLAMSSLRPPPLSDFARKVREARTMSIRNGTALTVTMKAPDEEGRELVLRFLPDGSVIGPEVDRWTGHPLATSQAAAQ